MVRAVENAQAQGLATAFEFESEAPIALIGSEWFHREGLRLDAGYYNAETIRAHRLMAESGLTMRRLGDVAERVFIPPRFKRVYVDEAHGVPFLQGTHISQFRPTDLKYLSRSAHRKFGDWTIRPGWILITRSGTVGRVAVALHQWDGWAASEHIIRIVPKDNSPCPPGYIYAWLSSPLGQAQFNGIFGAVVDEVSPAHVENILIPVPETAAQYELVNHIDSLVGNAIERKEDALDQDRKAIDGIDQLIDGTRNDLPLLGLDEADSESHTPISLIGSEWFHREGLRLDAGYYNAETIRAHRLMAESGLTMRRLGDVAERVFIPPRFKRVYVDEAHGVPFLQGTHISQFRPTDLKYLSRSAHRKFGDWTIRPGWILITRSGTVGRVAVALHQWDGWAASEHIIRIVPKDNSPCPPGYIYAWLSSPLGQAQFNGTYGAVVDELTASHAEDILIPVPATDEQRELVASIDALAAGAVANKERALEQDAAAVEAVSRLVPQWELYTKGMIPS